MESNSIDKYSAEILRSINEYKKHAGNNKKIPALQNTHVFEEDGEFSIQLRTAEDMFIENFRFVIGKKGKISLRQKKKMEWKSGDNGEPREKPVYEPIQLEIGELLLAKFRFGKFRGQFQEVHYGDNDRFRIDFNKFTHVTRLDEIQYLYYSMENRRFTIAQRFERPIGQAGGGTRYWTTIILPRLIENVTDVEEMLIGLLGSKTVEFLNNLHKAALAA